MHHTHIFIQDLAVLMLSAGLIIILCHRFKQPIVLGYILTGFIIGPHFLQPSFIHDKASIEIFSQLGVIFLMFCLGLEFNIRKLFSVGVAALIIAGSEVFFMIWIGQEIGSLLGWAKIDSLFLGAILAISSTTIVVKVLTDFKLTNARFAQLIFGALIIEDFLGIGIIALLSTVGVNENAFSMTQISLTMGKLLLFMVVSLVIGILLVPRIIQYIGKLKSDEYLLISVLGLCFGFCLLVVSFDYSIVLGAFLIGAIMAESKEIKDIERVIAPLRDLFSAVFFIAIGMMIDPQVLQEYFLDILVITAAVIIGKLIVCGLGAFVAGNDGKTSLQVGMGLSQIGEFSFIIAALGISLKVTGEYLYSITVAVSALTTLTAPYLIRSAVPLSNYLTNKTPHSISNVFRIYTDWIKRLSLHADQAVLGEIIKKIVIQVIVNLALVTAIFVGMGFFSEKIIAYLEQWIINVNMQKSLLLIGAVTLSLPFFIATYRKLKALAMLLAEMSLKGGNIKLQRIIAEIIPMFAMLMITLLLFPLSSAILPTTDMIIFVIVVITLIAIILWRWLVKIHARLQIALLETLQKK